MGKGIRAIQKSGAITESVQDQQTFDELFGLIFHHERPLVNRAANAVEKITRTRSEFLIPHREQLLSILKSGMSRELKRHIARLVPRIQLEPDDLQEVWGLLTYQALNPNESKAARSTSLQDLYELANRYQGLTESLRQTLNTLAHDPAVSIQTKATKLIRLSERMSTGKLTDSGEVDDKSIASSPHIQ